MTLSAKILLCLLLCTAALTKVHAADDELASGAIPAALMKNANAVMRYSHTDIHIVSAHEIDVTEKFAITILNEKGNEYAELKRPHDQFSDIDYMDGALYDRDGRQIKKVKKKSIIDVLPDGEAFAGDTHYNFFDFNCRDYPYTCVYEIRTIYNQSVFIEGWQSVDGHDVALQQADLEVDYPADFSLRYKCFHISDTAPAIADKAPTAANNGRTRLTWTVGQMPAIGKGDDFVPRENYSIPTIIFAADNFEMQDRQGRMSSWKDYGQFFYDLNKNRDTLPDAMKKLVHQLTDTCHTQAGKINILYNYLQKNYRYVNITFGIGGWQTFDASFVAEKSYGDCKALSNYMKSLLKEAGITSYQSLVYGSRDERREMMLDFPYSTFNHVILCVPQQNDTTWLECTSNTLPTGYLSSFTSNRNVLLLTPTGGVPVKTPGCSITDNKMVRVANIQVNDKNEMEGTVDLRYSGELWERESGMVINTPKSQVDNYLNSKFSIVNYTVTNYKVQNDAAPGHVPFLNEHIAIKGDGNITASGKNLFISPAVFSKGITAPSSYEKRKKDFSIHRSYTIDDTVVFHFNGQYTTESSSDEVNMHFAFADYHYNAVLENGNTLKVFITCTLKQGTYPAATFTDYIKLYKELNVNLGSNKIILTRVN